MTLTGFENIAVVCGNGLLPLTVIRALLSYGHKPLIVLLRGNVDKSLYEPYILKHCAVVEISISELSVFVNTLRKHDVFKVVLVGGVSSRPRAKDIKLDWINLLALKELLPAFKSGDDALLRSFIRFLEKFGFTILGPQQIVPDLLAPPAATLTKTCPNTNEKRNLSKAREAAKVLGALDIGQAVVAVGGRVVAVEGAEGTDNMLLRIKQIRCEKRIENYGGVLVKAAKPNQELRIDLPTIGLNTLYNAYQAGLKGIGVEAGCSFILDKAQVIQQANEYGMFISSF
ncbi:MAG: UDP-2,3-diacylglucosamine diphosphatase LpxI [Alphaproteobacteria bacterium]|nr:UDP-2,3-diacylglucosamine diphosphatase LpxI [Alphaproteobacteria bacterium]